MPLTPKNTPPYFTRSELLPKYTYSALLSQTLISTVSGLLVVGKKYLILTLQGTDDFANVGYVSDGTPFIATGTTPTSWTMFTIVINMTNSAPIPTILQNTFETEPEWLYEEEGVYSLNLTGGLEFGKTQVIISPNAGELIWGDWSMPDSIYISSKNSSGTEADNQMSQATFILNVYS